MSQKLYAIGATIETTVDGWTRSTEVPTFYLHPNPQGILTTERAEHVARQVLNPLVIQGITVHVVAEEVQV